MSDVLILNNRRPYFYVKFIDIIFEDVERYHDVSRYDRKESLLGTTVEFVSALLTTRPDLVIVVGSGFATLFVTLLGRLLPGMRLLFYHQDFTYQHMRDFKDYSRLRVGIERLQEGGPLWLCDAVGTMTPYHEKYLREKGIDKPFVRIPQGVFLDEFVPEAGEDIRRELDIDDSTLAVGVVGTFNRAPKHDIVYGWTVLEALADLREEDVVGVLIGSGDAMDYIEHRAEELGVRDKLVLTGHIQHEKLSEYLGMLDVTVLAKPDHPADKMTTTMKLPEYLAAGTYPIVDDNAYASTILDSDLVGVLPYEGIKDERFPGRVAEHLRMLLENPERLEAGKRHAREVAEKEFDYRTLKPRIRDDIERLLSN